MQPEPSWACEPPPRASQLQKPGHMVYHSKRQAQLRACEQTQVPDYQGTAQLTRRPNGSMPSWR